MDFFQCLGVLGVSRGRFMSRRTRDIGSVWTGLEEMMEEERGEGRDMGEGREATLSGDIVEMSSESGIEQSDG